MEIGLSTLLTDPMSILWKLIIRPPRSQYQMSDLGATKFRIGRRIYQREDLKLENNRGHILECSHFRPDASSRLSGEASQQPLPCVIYLHGNRSSRLEALDTLHELLPRNITVFCLDFSGSGKSEGEYISLGHFEEQDLEVVTQHLRASGQTAAVGLWGRSMGGATAVLRAAKDQALAGCIIDSAFSDLPTVAREVARMLSPRLPDFLLNMAIQSVRGEVSARAQFDMEDLLPIRHAPIATSPALFVVAKEDAFIPPHHTYDLHKAWGGNDKKLVTVGGGHDSARPPKFLQYAADWIQERLESAGAASEAPRGHDPAQERAASELSLSCSLASISVSVEARQVLSRSPSSGPLRPRLGRLSSPAPGDCGEDPSTGPCDILETREREPLEPCESSLSQSLRVCVNSDLGALSPRPRKLVGHRDTKQAGDSHLGSQAAVNMKASREAVLAVATPMASREVAASDSGRPRFVSRKLFKGVPRLAKKTSLEEAHLSA